MSSAVKQPRPKMTVAEYLAFEEQSDVKHEYYRGEVFAMAGGTFAHGRLQWRLPVVPEPQLNAAGCIGFNNDVRVKVEATGLYTYPDASVACGQPRCEGDRKLTLLNPRAVFEVLSKLTEAYDRGGKLEQYIRLPSLRHYVLISQARRRIDVYTRDDAGNWRFTFAQQPGDVVDLEYIGCRLSLDELYSGVELEPSEEHRSVTPE